MPQALVLKLELEEAVEERLVLGRVRAGHGEEALGGLIRRLLGLAAFVIGVAGHLEQDVAVVLGAEAVVEREGVACPARLLKVALERLRVVRVDEVEDALAEELVRREARQVLDRCRRKDEVARRTEHLHKVLLNVRQASATLAGPLDPRPS